MITELLPGDQRRLRYEKAMRGRIALLKHFVRNPRGYLHFFAQAFGVRARPCVAFL
jgi:hypothetical protein